MEGEGRVLYPASAKAGAGLQVTPQELSECTDCEMWTFSRNALLPSLVLYRLKAGPCNILE